VERLAERIRDGQLHNILAIPTSVRSYDQARDLGIPLVTLDTHPGKEVEVEKVVVVVVMSMLLFANCNQG